MKIWHFGLNFGLIELAAQLDDGKGLAGTVADVKDANKRGALHFAAREGRTEVCKYLLEELKLDVDAKDEDGIISLFILFLAIPSFIWNWILLKREKWRTGKDHMSFKESETYKKVAGVLNLMVQHGRIDLIKPDLWAVLGNHV